MAKLIKKIATINRNSDFLLKKELLSLWVN